jgi:membrane associated rhomboid family serine protease
MGSIKQDLHSEFKLSDTSMRIILVCTAILVGINIVLLSVTKLESSGLLEYYALYLAASSDPWYMLTHPWTLITHMFTHIQFDHWLWNMVGLLFSGRLFSHFLGNKSMFTTYLAGGLGGYALFFITVNLLPIYDGEVTVLGASAAIMAVLLGIATYAPNYEVSIWGIFNIRLKYLAALYVIFDFVSIRYFENTGGHIAHLGGALYGFILARYLREGINIQRIPEKWIGRLFFGERPVRMKVVSSKKTKTDEEFNADKLKNAKRVDALLDKISRGGYDSLTKEEKEFLFKQSQK